MTEKNFFLATAVLLTFAGALHFIRALAGWEMNISGFILPVWVSWALFLIAGFLAFHSWKFGARSKK